ncbi:hypothetical protein, partial [Komagataeibacter rhaeticus]|uniref:hypothetical protein n=1 Tax=Komagataeibacter rhaeticus TaxID=215221 RepID=UPI00242044CA
MQTLIRAPDGLPSRHPFAAEAGQGNQRQETGRGLPLLFSHKYLFFFVFLVRIVNVKWGLWRISVVFLCFGGSVDRVG